MPSSAPTAQQETAEKVYDEVSPLSSDVESDFEDDPLVQPARNSTELAQLDRELLDEEDGREKLLIVGSTRDKPRGFFNDRRNDGQSKGSGGKTGKRIAHRSWKRRRKAKGSSHDGDLMYEMEEGGPKSEISSQASSSSVELYKMDTVQSSTSKVSPAKPSKCGVSSSACVAITATEACLLAYTRHINCYPFRFAHVWSLQSLSIYEDFPNGRASF